MLRKCLFVLLIAAVAAGAAFTQEEADEGIAVRGKDGAKNTIVVDVGPTILGLGMAGFAMASMEEGFTPFGFGIGAQYERQINKYFSVAGRVAYLGFGLQYSFQDGGTSFNTNTTMSAITVEAHARYYPFGGAFFLGGILGYTNMSIKLSGKISVDNSAESINDTLTRDFIKFGTKLGWRIRFGKSGGGFTFEPSIGWDFGVSPSSTFVSQLVKKLGEEPDEKDSLDEAFDVIERFIFVGGPRVTLSFGWSF